MPQDFLSKVVTPASKTAEAGFKVKPGVAPTSPEDGDVWVTTAGIYVRVNGTTIGPLVALSSVPYDVGVGIAGTMPVTEQVLRFVAVTAFTIPASATGSQAKAGTAATSSYTFTVAKNGSSIGTIVFAAAGTTASFTFASSTSFAAGDILTITTAGTADATLANVGITLKGTLS